MDLILFTEWEHFTNAENLVSTSLEYIHVLLYYLLPNMMGNGETQLRLWDCSLLIFEIGVLRALLSVLPEYCGYKNP